MEETCIRHRPNTVGGYHWDCCRDIGCTGNLGRSDKPTSQDNLDNVKHMQPINGLGDGDKFGTFVVISRDGFRMAVGATGKADYVRVMAPNLIILVERSSSKMAVSLEIVSV